MDTQRAETFWDMERWPHFRPGELACRHCGELWPGDGPMPALWTDTLDALEALRGQWGRPIVITSGHRCPVHNSSVGGGAASRHLELAVDVAVSREDQDFFVDLAERSGFTGIGRYPARNFVHLDMGTSFPRRWWG